ncbi:MAG: apolipoprotein N-acyltransferase [Kiritimatiellaceae bacterium]|nr:apolipoprotein N-acyltransferase [Kiritimatiellaceae bacterium]
MKKLFSIIASICTGGLLFLSFPPFGFSFCGWLALIPLIFACAGSAPRRAAFLGWLAGTVFFLSSLFWLRHVSLLGTVGLAFYCALYFTPFAVFVSLRRDGWRCANALKNIGWMSSAAAVWAASEYVRATFATGFPWNLLGVSQYKELAVIQIAEWGGVYAISALMVFVSAAFAVTILQYAAGLRKKYRMHTEMICALLAVAMVWSVGIHTLLSRQNSGGIPVRAALIQPNVPEVGNWETTDPDVIYEKLERLTALVQHVPNLDLIIWPETALPDMVRFSQRGAELVRRLAAAGTPLLAGSMDAVQHADTQPDYYNASMLFNTSGELLGTYYKQHLVLFGEYIPFEGKIPLINALTPIGSSFMPGRTATQFKLPGGDRAFSVLICFEDSLPYLARKAARAGADLLVNQTNDSWFDPDCGSEQHLANAVFRCIETRLPMLRCANTGITCAVDPLGRITQTLAPRTEGFQVVETVPADPACEETFYVRFGDLFAQACLASSVALFIVSFIKRRKTSDA